MTTTISGLEEVVDELSRVDARACKLYKTCKDSRLRAFADELKSLLKCIDIVAEQIDKFSFLRSREGEPNRAKLQCLLRDCQSTLWRLEDYLARHFGPRDLPPPPLNESRDVQAELKSRRNALLMWIEDLVNEPARETPRALPPSSPPPARKRTPPATSAERSPATPTAEKYQEKYHRRHTSYGGGGVPLPRPINTNLRPPSSDAGSRSATSPKAPLSPYQATVEEIPDEGSPEDDDRSPYVSEYHMTPPGSSFEASSESSVAQEPSTKAVAPNSKSTDSFDAQSSSSNQEKKQALPKVVMPDINRKTSYKDKPFLSPHDAVPRPDQSREEVWQRPEEDFQLWDTDDDELEEEPMGARTPFRVESMSAQNTPRDNMPPPPPPRPRAPSRARSAQQQGDTRSGKQSPRYSPGHSPWVNTQSYPDDGRFVGTGGKEKFTPQPSPRDPSKEYVSARRPRAATHTQGAPYPPDDAPFYAGSSAFHFMTGAAEGTFNVDPRDVFNKFLGGGGTSNDDRDMYSTASKEKEKSASDYDERNSRTDRGSRDGEAPPKEITTQITLEEFFSGTKRKMKVTGKDSGNHKIIELPIRPGLRTGAKIRVSGIEIDPDSPLAEINFSIQEKPHPRFTRQGDDLHTTIDIDLYESLCGWERYITSICGKDVRVRSTTPTGPKWKECYAGLGMPKNKKPSERGDLWVGVNVSYPAALSEEKRKMLRDILRP
ncbi:hypothetical protein NA57DRAFT_80996 [Rhizodiscina lignyota]|uniref:Chaperone DnaJ C-terminal domain-containing protein n=1 Tax=Rhizodiscina lignyota TaxID=1504668 RepID=A0A9P4I5S3_9PEZI|nr:hypothetical protein NA57DRAFT_80996 [Rhizodiscina lignyota]